MKTVDNVKIMLGPTNELKYDYMDTDRWQIKGKNVGF